MTSFKEGPIQNAYSDRIANDGISPFICVLEDAVQMTVKTSSKQLSAMPNKDGRGSFNIERHKPRLSEGTGDLTIAS